MKVSAVALGGWTTFGESIEDAGLARKIITTAYEEGINFFDIADAYAGGESERMMGSVLKDFPRHTLVISSKVFFPMSDEVNDRGLSRKHITESIDKSLKRIGTDYLDIYFCHRFDPDTPVDEVARAMDDLVHRGKVLYWGTSMWTGAQIAEAVGTAKSMNLYPPSAEQSYYNMMRREHVEKEILQAVRPHGIGVTAFSPLNNGILTGKYDDGITEDSRAARVANVKRRLSDNLIDKVRKLKAIADDLGLTRGQLAVAWALRHPEVSTVIGGATKPEHIEDNVKAAEAELDDETLGRIDELFPA